MDIKSMRENPELFRICLKKTVEELAHQLSTNDTFKETRKEFLQIEIYLQDYFKDAMIKSIDMMWNECDITAKMVILNELEKKSPSNCVTWRPTAGVVPILTIEGYYLTNLKQQLLLKIERKKTKIETEKKELIEKSKILNKYWRKISINEKRMLQMFKLSSEMINMVN